MVILLLAQAALIAALAWTFRARWLDSKMREQAVLQKPAAARNLVVPPPLPPPKAPAAAEYEEVAQLDLFSKDRNPNVVIEPPPPPPPPKEPPMPALPRYHGQMAFDEPVAILSEGNGDQNGYHAGDKIGEFKVISFDHETIAFEWRGKTVQRKLDELKPAENTQAAAQTPDLRAQAPAATQMLAPPPAKELGSSISSSDPKLGTDMGGTRACVPGDNSPAGTVLNGYTKKITQGMFGPSCFWEPTK